MTELQAAIGKNMLNLLDKQIKRRNLIADLYLKELKKYFQKINIFKTPDFKCNTCTLKHKKNSCNNVYMFYRLNLFFK